MASPYAGVHVPDWKIKTQELIESHPLKTAEIVEVVLQAWNDIFDSKLGPKGFQIGVHILPKPQIMGFFLHELIQLEFGTRYPRLWRAEKTSNDKDLVYIPNDEFSIEIKTSSNPNRIFGNRSYAQESKAGKKDKSGYYLTANFEKFGLSHKPQILLIRFGWIDHTDWVGQKAATGQQAHLTPDARNSKLLSIYSTE